MATLAAAEAAPPLHKHYYALGERCTARAHTAAVEPRAPAAPSAASSTPRESTPLPLNTTGRNPRARRARAARRSHRGRLGRQLRLHLSSERCLHGAPLRGTLLPRYLPPAAAAPAPPLTKHAKITERRTARRCLLH